MRAVVDTNVLVSGLMGSNGPPWQVVDAITSGTLRPVLCSAIVAEYRHVLPRPRLRIRPDRIAALLELIEQTGDWVMVPPYAGTPPLPDLDDWPFLAAALVADCPLITGNARHFPSVSGLRLMSARDWVQGTAGGN